MMKRMMLAGLLAAVATPALSSDATYDVRVLSLDHLASAAPTHEARTGKKIAKAAKRECTCEGRQAHAPASSQPAPQPH